MKLLSLTSRLVLILTFVFHWGCGSSDTVPQNKDLVSKDPTTLELKLKRGMKVLMAHRQMNPALGVIGKPGMRILTLEEPSGAEGVVFAWINPPDPSSPQPVAETQPDPDGPDPQPLQSQVFDLDAVQNGKMSLPNLAQARNMIPPLFWPSGDLFLSNYAGIWLSDAAFEELRNKKSTQWNPGLTQNPILGPAEGNPSIVAGLKILADSLITKEQGLADSPGLPPLKVKGVEKISLTVDGKKQEVEVLNASHPLAAYKILNNAQNPMILEFMVAPEASPLQVLTTPLGLLMGLAEYRVVEIQSPEFQAQNREPGTVKEM